MSTDKKTGPSHSRIILLALAAAAILITATVLLLFSSQEEDSLVDLDRAGTSRQAGRPEPVSNLDTEQERRRIGPGGSFQPVTLKGSLSLDGAPLSGVTVRAYSDLKEEIPSSLARFLRTSPLAHGAAFSEVRKKLEQRRDEEAIPAAEALTGPGGVFSLTFVPSDTTTFGLDHDFYFLPPDQAGPFSWELEEGAEPVLSSFEGRLETRLGALIRGVVKDSEGLLLEKTVVELDQIPRERRGGMFMGGESGEFRLKRTETGRDGAYLIRAAPPGQDLFLTAQNPDFAESRSKSFDASPGSTLTFDLTLDPGSSISAFVRGPDDSLLEGAEVLLEKKSNNNGEGPRFMRMMSGDLVVDHGKTDSAGRILFKALLPGDYSLKAAYPGMVTAKTDETLTVNGGRGESIRAELALQWGHSIVGSVVDDRARPVENVLVDARPAIGGFSFSVMRNIASAVESEMKRARTDGGGRFRITGLDPENKYNVTAGAEGFLTASKENVSPDKGNVSLVLERPGQIRGEVVDGETGKPVRVFNLRIAPGEEAGGSDRSGWNRGGPTGNRSPFGGRGRSERRERDSDRRSSTTNSRSASRDISLLFDAIRETFRGSFERTRRRTDRDEKIRDEQGRFFLREILPGDYRLCVSAEGRAPGVTDIITVEKGRTVEGLFITLGPGGSISGEVRDWQGPVKKAEVLIARDRTRPPGLALALESVSECRTGRNGEFLLKNLPKGRFVLDAVDSNHPDASSNPIELEAGQTVEGMVIMFPGGGTITGTVLDAMGIPIESARVFCSSEDGSTKRESSNVDGRFEFKGLGEGRFTIRLISGPGSFFSRNEGPDSVTVSIAEGEVKDIVLSEPPLTGATVSGTVTDGGMPLDNGFLTVSGTPDSGVRTAVINSDGSYAVEGVEPGTRTFTVRFSMDDRFENVSLSYEIPDRSEIVLHIELPSGEISGTVTDAASGTILEGVVITLESESDRDEDRRGGGRWSRWGSTKRDRTDEKGAFLFRKLPAGTYRLQATSQDTDGTGYRPTEIAGINLMEGRSLTGLNVLLYSGGGLRISVSNKEGDPVARALAGAVLEETEHTSLSSSRTHRMRTDQEGKALITGLDPGLYTISVQANGFGQVVRKGIRVAEERIADAGFTLETGHEVSARLNDSKGEPIRGARLTLRNDGGEKMNLPPTRGRGFFGRSGGGNENESNLYPLGFLCPGNYTLEAKWDGSSGSSRFSITGPGTIRLRLEP